MQGKYCNKIRAYFALYSYAVFDGLWVLPLLNQYNYYLQLLVVGAESESLNYDDVFR